MGGEFLEAPEYADALREAKEIAGRLELSDARATTLMVEDRFRETVSGRSWDVVSLREARDLIRGTRLEAFFGLSS